MTSTINQRDLLNVLSWQRAMGADAAISAEATDWLHRAGDAPGSAFLLERPADVPVVAHQAQPLSTQARRASQVVAPPIPLSNRPAVQTQPPPKWGSSAGVIEAENLQDLETKLRAFDGCGLKTTATNLCFFRGASAAKLMVIGEAPGREEDLEGRPFVGRGGQLLDRMLAAIDIAENAAHLTNIVYWRPPGNRAPTPQEAASCRPFLERQIELVDPQVVLLLGGSAGKHILETDDGILRIRGRWSDMMLGGRLRKTIATLHPVYLLQTPASKRQAWQDLLSVKEQLT